MIVTATARVNLKVTIGARSNSIFLRMRGDCMQVFQMAPLNGDPDPRGTCSHVPPPDPPPPPPPPEELPGDISGQKEIREVHVSMGLMEEFLA